MNRAYLFDLCRESLAEVVSDRCRHQGPRQQQRVLCQAHTPQGIIEITLWPGESPEVSVVHLSGADHDCPALCEAIERSLPGWEALIQDQHDDW